MPSASSGAAIPVEALLKLQLDKQGSKTVTDFMDHHEQSWSRIESSISRVGQGIEGLARKGLALAGVAGIGAVLQNFMQTSTAGSQLGLAAGHVTGGMNVWHGYGQAMLGAQAKTGVPANDIAQGMISALQMVGGTPTPQQAGVIGGLLAGFGQTVGMSPSQVSSVIGPLLQASHQPLNMSSAASMMATVVQNMGSFPGSQIAPMLPLVAQLAQQQALGSYGAMGHPNVGGIAAALRRQRRSSARTGEALTLATGCRASFTPLAAWATMACGGTLSSGREGSTARTTGAAPGRCSTRRSATRTRAGRILSPSSARRQTSSAPRPTSSREVVAGCARPSGVAAAWAPNWCRRWDQWRQD